MLEQYTGAAIMFLLSMGIACGMIVMTSLLGPKKHFADKMEPFECGESQLVSPHQRFSVKFYLVGVLFVLFDIEAIFFFPWAILFRRLGMFGFIEMILFVFILAAFNLVASLTMLYVEKKESVQLLSAIGMSKNDVFKVFFYEGLLISGWGIFLGLILGYAVCILQLTSEFLIIPGANIPFPIVFTLSDFGLILGSVSILSFVFSYFPVRLIVKSA
mgnify:CR=1 FL=1